MTVEHAGMTKAADDALLVAAYAGDERAFEQLFTRHYRRVYHIALRVVGNPEDAEEVALDTFVRLHQRRINVGSGSEISGWLYRTATNAAFNTVRARTRRAGWRRKLAGQARTDSRESEDPAAVFERDEAASQVRRILADLPERQRNALILRASGLNYGEVAAAIDVKPSSVGKILARAEEKMRDMVQREGGM